MQGLERVMRMLDDFQRLPRVDFELTVSRPSSWAEKLSALSGSEVVIDPVMCKGKRVTAHIIISSESKPRSVLGKLRAGRVITQWKQLQEADDKAVFSITVEDQTTADSLCSMAEFNFELLYPVVARGRSETYRFSTLDVEKADEYFGKFIKKLKRMRGISIVGHTSRKVGPVPPVKSRVWGQEERDLIRELIRTDYFNPDNKDRPKQDDLAAKLSISAGKLNQMLREIEHIGFQNLLAVRPDLEEFRRVLREVEEEESTK